MVKTHGLTHISLAVRDPERSLRFYQHVFGLMEQERTDAHIVAQGPGPHGVMAFERNERTAGVSGGIQHFGFQLLTAADLDAALEAVRDAGGTVLGRGEREGGGVYAYVADPDGYEIEILWE